MKFILVTGGVISGVGKGVIASSLGHLLQNNNINTTFIKIDPYLNIDAGNLTPYDHGEVFVLRDGHQCDLDLGNYERFLDICLTVDHSITTGKVYKEIINRERDGYYQGQTIQMVPHVTNYIVEKIIKTAHKPTIRGENSLSDTQKPEVCIIELGGTIGDIESLVFIEALRQLKMKNPKKFLIISVEHMPIINNEFKTKTVQNSVKIARTLGIKPDIIVARAEDFKDRSFKDKISLFCEVPKQNIIPVKDLNTIYAVPNLLCKKKALNILAKFFKFELPHTITHQFQHLSIKPKLEIEIAIVGKYIENTDCYLSLINALMFSGAHHGAKVKQHWIDAEKVEQNDLETFKILKSVHGVLIPGGFGIRGFEGKIKAANFARENDIPFLGICLGFQSAVISFCRNVLNIKNAISEEVCIEVQRRKDKAIRLKEKEQQKMTSQNQKVIIPVSQKQDFEKINVLSQNNDVNACATISTRLFDAIPLVVEGKNSSDLNHLHISCETRCKEEAIGYEQSKQNSENYKPIKNRKLGQELCKVDRLKKLSCKLSSCVTPKKAIHNALNIDDESENNNYKKMKFNAMKETRINAKQRDALKETLETPVKVIVQMDHNQMRLGEHKILLRKGLIHDIYQSDEIIERHRHRFEVDNLIVEDCEKNGLFFTGTSDFGRAEIFEMTGMKFYVGTQFHPELIARPNRPHPVFNAFIKASVENMLE